MRYIGLARLSDGLLLASHKGKKTPSPSKVGTLFGGSVLRFTDRTKANVRRYVDDYVERKQAEMVISNLSTL